MHAMAVGAQQEGTGPYFQSFWSLAPYGVVVLRLSLNTASPLRDARWLMANPAAERLLPGAHRFRGLRVRELGAEAALFSNLLVRWEEALRRQGRFTEEVVCTCGGQQVVLHADALQSGDLLTVWLRDVTAERHDLEPSGRTALELLTPPDAPASRRTPPDAMDGDDLAPGRPSPLKAPRDRERRYREKAREAERLERFMGILGHDLGGPLAAIRIMAQLLRRASNLTSSQHVQLGRIESSTERLTRMAQQLLDGVRARQGSLPMRPRPVDLAQVCRPVLDEFALLYPQRVIHFEVEGEHQGAWDPDRLAQAVSNLVGNALEHGERTAPIRVRLADDHGLQRLEVTNGGEPIAPALLPHLFEPFRGTHRRERPVSGGGVGLGLFIVREIARAHQGEVVVRSSAAEGTTFGLVLPRHPSLHN